MSFKEQAACRGKTALMYDHARERRAKAVCAACPVLEACRDHVMSTESTMERFGVAGGMSPRERFSSYQRRLRRALLARTSA